MTAFEFGQIGSIPDHAFIRMDGIPPPLGERIELIDVPGSFALCLPYET
jgi:hypothetical protein